MDSSDRAAGNYGVERVARPLSSVAEVLEERLFDKTDWERGPWIEEPDRVEWRDPASGLPCMLHRTPTSGHWCGYVGVAPEHPWHGIEMDMSYEDDHPEAHGGITYSRACGGHICHVPLEGESHETWWIGFDAAHAYDCIGFAYASAVRGMVSSLRSGTYRDQAYMMSETTSLAEQAMEALRRSYAPARIEPDATPSG